MSTRPSTLTIAPGRVDWRRAEFILTALAFVGFITIGIRLKTIYSSLPAHPLFVHVPVVLIPISILGALACIARPYSFHRVGVGLCLCAIVAMSSVFLSMEAGAALLPALHLTGRAASLISQHQQAAHILAVVFTLFTAALILTFASHRISDGMPTGLGIADVVLGSRAIHLLLRGALVVLALVCAYYVYRVGDLGAKAVWLGRLHAA